MIGRTNTGGGRGIADAFAVIAVTYPEGSTCTCTNGTKTLKAKDTSGSYLFLIPEAGTWTVIAIDGAETASKSFDITQRYQSASVSLNYWDGFFYKDGKEYVTQTGGWSKAPELTANSGQRLGNGTVEKNTTSIKLMNSGNTIAPVATARKIDLRACNTLYASITSNYGAANSLNVLSDKSGDVSKVSLAQIVLPLASSETTVQVDVSEITEGYIAAVASGQNRTVTIFKVWTDRR